MLLQHLSITPFYERAIKIVSPRAKFYIARNFFSLILFFEMRGCSILRRKNLHSFSLLKYDRNILRALFESVHCCVSHSTCLSRRPSDRQLFIRAGGKSSQTPPRRRVYCRFSSGGNVNTQVEESECGGVRASLDPN